MKHVALFVILLRLIVFSSTAINGSLLGIGISLSLLVSLLDWLSERFVNLGELLNGDTRRILSDGGMHLLVKLLKIVSSDRVLKVSGKVSLEVLLIVLLHLPHVVSDVLTHDASLVGSSIERLGISVESRKSLITVRNVKSTVTRALHGAKNFSTSGGVLDSNIEQSTERSLLVVDLTNKVSAAIDNSGHNIASWLLNTSVSLIKANLLQKTASQQKSSAVSSSIVLQTSGQTVLDQLLGRSRTQNLVTVDLGVDNLADNITVGESHNQTVLR